MINKVFNKILRSIGSVYDYLFFNFIFNKELILEEEEEKFNKEKFNREKSKNYLNKILKKLSLDNYDENSDSVHWLISAAISQEKNINRILEIGTYNGEFTAILSELFPNSDIVSIDLPETDPLLRSTYNREDEQEYEKFKEKQKKNISNSNRIELILSNSFFLRENVEGKFDFIWVDGGHNFPEIAWDICNCYDLLSKGGILMCDDVIKLDDYNEGFVSNDSYKVLEYINQRLSSNILYFLKRLDGKRYARSKNRKYVAFLKK